MQGSGVVGAQGKGMFTRAKDSHGQEGLQLPAAGAPAPPPQEGWGSPGLAGGPEGKGVFLLEEAGLGEGGLGGVPSSTLEGGLR